LIVKDINPGAASSTPFILKNYTSPKGFGAADTSLFAGKIFLTATTAAAGSELWITNGTAAGTLLVKDIRVGKKNGIDTSFSYIYTTAGLYFSANDSLKGIEPWKSNGTAAGTLNVANINPLLKSSSPLFMFIFNNSIFLNANNGDNTLGKRDLYKVNAVTVPLPTMEPAPELLEVVAPNSKLKFVVAPNPVQHDLNIQLDGIASKEVSIRIVDNNGKVIVQRKLAGASNLSQRLNVSGLQKGIYYLQLVTDTETRIAKFVKE